MTPNCAIKSELFSFSVDKKMLNLYTRMQTSFQSSVLEASARVPQFHLTTFLPANETLRFPLSAAPGMLLPPLLSFAHDTTGRSTANL
jgi:hypothetical protein